MLEADARKGMSDRDPKARSSPSTRCDPGGVQFRLRAPLSARVALA